MNEIKKLLKPLQELIDETKSSAELSDEYKEGYEEAMLQAISMIEILIMLLTKPKR